MTKINVLMNFCFESDAQCKKTKFMVLNADEAHHQSLYLSYDMSIDYSSEYTYQDATIDDSGKILNMIFHQMSKVSQKTLLHVQYMYKKKILYSASGSIILYSCESWLKYGQFLCDGCTVCIDVFLIAKL